MNYFERFIKDTHNMACDAANKRNEAKDTSERRFYALMWKLETLFQGFATICSEQHEDLLKAIPCSCKNANDIHGTHDLYVAGIIKCERCKQLEALEK